MIKLIASDMDGTLLNEHGKLNEEIFPIIHKLKEKDILFVVASGRQYYNLKNKFSKLEHDIPYIAENGSYVVFKNKEMSSSILDKATTEQLLEQGRRLQECEIILCGKKGAYIEKGHETFVNEVKKYYLKYEIVDNLNEVNDDILKFTICDFKGAAENSNKILHPLWKDKLKVTVSGKVWLDIMNKDSNKGVAIKLLQEKFNIKPEETMVFGDYFNDIEMLNSAYFSYAMENAPEEVKKHARFYAKSNRENGVLEIIKHKIF
ncbi:Cof-type HAD-IIB family hydrolase [Clostridium malenominatum]|uniref:Cof-type HAD-IIB family hydrolase n=1 Tax=Clostridium malenominatum TaxID=1539 RepID=A0ABP3U2G1_9CLOT